MLDRSRTIAPCAAQGRGGRLVVAVLAALAMTCAAVSPAAATTVLWLPVDQMAARSDLVVVAEVVSATPIDDDHPLGIHTDFVLEVTDLVSGAAPASLVVRLPGGTVGQRTTAVEGVPELRTGERYVFLLERVPATGFPDADGPRWVPLGLALGTWHVEETDGAAVAVPITEGLVPLTTSGHPAPEPVPVALDILLDALREVTP